MEGSEKVEKWLAEKLAEVTPYSRPLCIKGNKGMALLCIDCQNFFIHPDGGAFLPMSKETMGPLRKLAQGCKEASVPIFTTAHGHKEPELDGGMLHQWWGSSIIEGTWDHQLHDDFQDLTSEAIINKKRYDSFHGTKLAERLDGLNIDTLVIGGVMTNLCCETTARAAFVRDFRVLFLADGTATASREFHSSSLLNLAFGFAHIVTCSQVEELIASF